MSAAAFTESEVEIAALDWCSQDGRTLAMSVTHVEFLADGVSWVKGRPGRTKV